MTGLDAAAQLWVPIAEIARRAGVSRVAAHKNVRRWEAQGVLSTRPGPRGTVLVNQVVYDRLRREIADPSQALRNGRADELDLHEDERHELADVAVPGAQPASDGGAGRASYHASRAEREAYQAENARLDLEGRLDRLIDRDTAERLTMTTFRRVRDSLLALPATVAGRCAAAPNEQAVRAILADEFRRVLEALAVDLDRREVDADDDGASEGGTVVGGPD